MRPGRTKLRRICTNRRCNSPLKGVFAGERLAEHERVDLVRALVRVDALEVHEVPDDWILEQDAVGTEQVAGRTRRFERHLDVVALAERHLRG